MLRAVVVAERRRSRWRHWLWPVGSRKQRPKVEVFQEVLLRLRECECEEVSEPNFEDELWSHFNRLPVSFILMVMKIVLTLLQPIQGIRMKDAQISIHPAPICFLHLVHHQILNSVSSPANCKVETKI